MKPTTNPMMRDISLSSDAVVELVSSSVYCSDGITTATHGDGGEREGGERTKGGGKRGC